MKPYQYIAIILILFLLPSVVHAQFWQTDGVEWIYPNLAAPANVKVGIGMAPSFSLDGSKLEVLANLNDFPAAIKGSGNSDQSGYLGVRGTDDFDGDDRVDLDGRRIGVLGTTFIAPAGLGNFHVGVMGVSKGGFGRAGEFWHLQDSIISSSVQLATVSNSGVFKDKPVWINDNLSVGTQFDLERLTVAGDIVFYDDSDNVNSIYSYFDDYQIRLSAGGEGVNDPRIEINGASYSSNPANVNIISGEGLANGIGDIRLGPDHGSFQEIMRIDNEGYVGITNATGTRETVLKLMPDASNNNVGIFFSDNPSNFDLGMGILYNGTDNRLEFFGRQSGIQTTWMYVQRGDATNQVNICGRLRAEEVLVDVGWCDYVFDDDYQLMPLREVEAYIEENHHLPGIPAGVTVETEGLSLGSMSAKFMEKIEELTLYAIEQNKKITTQENEIKSLRMELAEIKILLSK